MLEIENILKQIDFLNDDGIVMYMINDGPRNLFYKGILHECQDQHCIDIGFGTGLLSFAALDRGAKSVTAYEVNEQRYEIGKYIIKKLNLEDKITLINRRFMADEEDVKNKCVFHELISQRVWGENLYNVLGNANIRLLPNQYTMEVSAFEFNSIQEAVSQVFGYPTFTPVIGFKTDFVNTVQEIIDKWVDIKNYHTVPHSDKLTSYRQQATPIADYSYTVTPTDRILEVNDQRGSYQTSLLNNSNPTFELNIESDKPRLLFCDYYVKHNQYTLHVSGTNWSYTEDSQYLINKGITRLNHTLLTGRSTLS